jgi:adenosylcobinamide kinase/adenosylcobinamide-phosphate guanylyltransferase
MSRKLVFITGGARSGKSTFALKEASKISGKKAFIATAVGAYGNTPLQDEEMRERIENHKRNRGKDWDTYEEPLKIADVIKKIEGEYSVIVVDCLTLWLSNLMHSGLNITNAINDLIKVLDGVNVGATLAVAQKNKTINKRAGASPAPTIYIVSNEVGMGIVPDNEMARRFRDMAGFLNQKVAGIADEVYMVIAGIPVRVK